MKKQETEIGGCCMGIPFGCSSIFLLIVGVGLWQHTGSAWFVLGAVAPSAIAAIVTAPLLTARWVKQRRYAVAIAERFER